LPALLTETLRESLLGKGRGATERAAVADWVGREILPHEGELRAWLQRRVVARADVEDIVQECYCQLAQLTDVAHIVLPRAYLFTIARHLAERQRKRARVVRIEPLNEWDDDRCDPEEPSPERIAVARQELGRVDLLRKSGEFP